MTHTTDADAGNPALQFDRQICYPLYAASNAVVRAYRPLLAALDLTYLQYMVLMLLWEEHSMTVKELGERMLLDSGTLTPLLKRLEAKDLVTRTRGEEDERVRIITISTSGMALREKAESIPHDLACSLGVSPAQGSQMKALCEQLLEAVRSKESDE